MPKPILNRQLSNALQVGIPLRTRPPSWTLTGAGCRMLRPDPILIAAVRPSLPPLPLSALQ